MKNETKNQVHPIKRDGNLRKVIFKNNSGASMILFKDIDVVNASVRVEALRKMYKDWRGKFIVVR